MGGLSLPLRSCKMMLLSYWQATFFLLQSLRDQTYFKDFLEQLSMWVTYRDGSGVQWLSIEALESALNSSLAKPSESQFPICN